MQFYTLFPNFAETAGISGTVKRKRMENRVDRMLERVVGYYASCDASQIAHTLCVHQYTRLLALGEGYDPHRIELLETAALLHDIGCTDAKRKYGNSLPVNQQREGARIAAEWLVHDPSLAPADAQWIVGVVGSHHNALKAAELGFETLFEADLIVNLFEGYYPVEKAPVYYRNMVRTVSGRMWFVRLFPECAGDR